MNATKFQTGHVKNSPRGMRNPNAARQSQKWSDHGRDPYPGARHRTAGISALKRCWYWLALSGHVNGFIEADVLLGTCCFIAD